MKNESLVDQYKQMLTDLEQSELATETMLEEIRESLRILETENRDRLWFLEDKLNDLQLQQTILAFEEKKAQVMLELMDLELNEMHLKTQRGEAFDSDHRSRPAFGRGRRCASMWAPSSPGAGRL